MLDFNPTFALSFYGSIIYMLVFDIFMWMVVVHIRKSSNVNKKKYLANVTRDINEKEIIFMTLSWLSNM